MKNGVRVALLIGAQILIGIGGLIGIYCSDQKMDMLIDEKLDEREKKSEETEER